LLKCLSLRKQTTTFVDVGKKEPSYTAGGNAISYNYYGKQYVSGYDTYIRGKVTMKLPVELP
jgi:hypothetical protein